jgi:type I restriction enzyme S subunit
MSKIMEIDVTEIIDGALDRSKWIKWKFSELFENVVEKVVPKKSGIEHYIGLEHLDSGSLHIKRFGETASLIGDKLKIYKGDIIFAKRNAYLKRASIAPFDAVVSAHSLVLRPKSNNVLPDFIPFFLMSEEFWERAIEISVGSLSPTINWKILAKQEFLLPPKVEQAKLAELLWAMDEVIEREKRLIDKLEIFNESTSQKLLGISVTPPKTWRTLFLEDVAPLQRGFDLPNQELAEGPYPVGYSNGITNYHKEYKVEGPGVWTGRSGTIGNVFYTDENYWPHNTSLWVTDFKGNQPKYIYYLYSKLHFEKRMTGTGVPTLNRNDIHKFKIAIPEFKEQIEITNKLDQLNKLSINIKEKLNSSQSLQKSLINQVF